MQDMVTTINGHKEREGECARACVSLASPPYPDPRGHRGGNVQPKPPLMSIYNTALPPKTYSDHVTIAKVRHPFGFYTG